MPTACSPCSCARARWTCSAARHDVLAVTQPEGDRARVLRLCKALGVSVRPNADHAGLARTHAALPLAAADFTALLLGEAVCAPDAYGVNAAVPRTLVRWLIAAEAERAGNPCARSCAPLSAPDADCAGVSCALTDFCFYHLVRCGAHPRRILRLARAAFGGAARTRTFCAPWRRSRAACSSGRQPYLTTSRSAGAHGRCAGRRTRLARSGSMRSTRCAGSCPDGYSKIHA